MGHVVNVKVQTAAASCDAADEELARHSAARLLITAPIPGRAEVVARRIHQGSGRATLPLVRMPAIDLPGDRRMLSRTCSRLLDSASGGTLFISDVDEMKGTVQASLIDVLMELEWVRGPSTAVRLMSGTTVSLVDRIAAGTFSAQLFYRLNIIHVTA